MSQERRSEIITAVVRNLITDYKLDNAIAIAQATIDLLDELEANK